MNTKARSKTALILIAVVVVASAALALSSTGGAASSRSLSPPASSAYPGIAPGNFQTTLDQEFLSNDGLDLNEPILNAVQRSGSLVALTSLTLSNYDVGGSGGDIQVRVATYSPPAIDKVCPANPEGNTPGGEYLDVAVKVGSTVHLTFPQPLLISSPKASSWCLGVFASHLTGSRGALAATTIGYVTTVG